MKSEFRIYCAFFAGLSCTHADIPNTVTFRDFFGGQATFQRPTFFAEVPGRDSHYVVLEQYLGQVNLVRRSGGSWIKEVFLRLPVYTSGNEQGLVGFTFHPDYPRNRKYYLNYNQAAGGRNSIEEREADSSLLRDAGLTPRQLFLFDQPSGGHNGGTLAFGRDGYLYLGIGDGGTGGWRARDSSQLRGKILRVDVNQATVPYAIPPDNPFVGRPGYRSEIWALGLRNPWKWSFHPQRDEVWAGDVGDATYEEISRIPKGGDMGWNIWEGAHCFPPGTPACNSAGMTPPILELPQAGFVASCIIGGVFFTGSPASAFNGLYIFGDYGMSTVWALREQNGTLVEYESLGRVMQVSSINTDSRGRIFALSFGNGNVQILESPDMIPTPVRPAPRLRPIAKADLFDHSKYSLRGLDGRAVKTEKARGLLVAQEKGARAMALVPVLW